MFAYFLRDPKPLKPRGQTLPATSENNIINTSFQNGDLDSTGAARIVLRDWNIGKFARYTAPTPRVKEPSDGDSEDMDAGSFLTSLYAKAAPAGLSDYLREPWKRERS